jgi:hypothetical protein
MIWKGMAYHNKEWHRNAWHEKERHAKAMHGMTRKDSAWHGKQGNERPIPKVALLLTEKNPNSQNRLKKQLLRH